MNKEDMVRKIIEFDDAMRIDLVGGYGTEWQLIDGVVYWAALDPSKDYNRTELIVEPVDVFIEMRMSEDIFPELYEAA